MQQKSVVEMGKMFLTCVFWSLWKTRNRACFVNVMPHFFIIDTLLLEASNYIRHLHNQDAHSRPQV
jgi:hypothetical protein